MRRHSVTIRMDNAHVNLTMEGDSVPTAVLTTTIMMLAACVSSLFPVIKLLKFALFIWLQYYGSRSKT